MIVPVFQMEGELLGPCGHGGLEPFLAPFRGVGHHCESDPVGKSDGFGILAESGM